MVGIPQFTESDILTLKEIQEMGRNFATNPKLQKTAPKKAPARWYIRPSAPVLQGGRLKPKQFNPVYLGYCDEMTQREAERAAVEVCRALNRTIVTGFAKSEIQFGKFVEMYRKDYLPALAPETQRGYEIRIEKHILPAFGDWQLARITKQDVQNWVNRIDGTINTRRVVLGTLASIFSAALEWEYLEKRNPCDRVRITRGSQPERDLTVPEPEDLNRFLAATYEPYRTMIEVGLYCGLRPGEVRGLIGRSVDPPYLHVLFNRDRHTNELGPPKRRSKRRVALPDWLAVKLEMFASAGLDALLWPSVEYCAMWEHFHTRAKAAGIWRPGMSWHTLRRCYATYMNEMGAEGLQQAMGHKSATMTQKYIRPSVRRQLEQVEAMRSMVVGGVQ